MVPLLDLSSILMGSGSTSAVPLSVLRFSTLGVSAACYLILSFLLLLLFLYLYTPETLLAAINAQITRWSGMRSRHVQVGAYHWHYLEAGDPQHPPIVLVHGFGMDSSMWAVIGGRLMKRGYRIIAPDLVGFGQTVPYEADSYTFTAHVERLHGFLQVVLGQGTRFHIGGTSMGGAISGIYSATYPEDVLSCWLLCPAAILSSHTSEFCERLKVSRVEGNILLSHTVDDMRVVFQHLFHHPPFVPDGVFRAWAREKQQRLPIQRCAMEHLTGPGQVFLMGEKLRDIQAPLCVAWGEHDDILDVTCVDVIRKEAQRPSDTLLVDSGHAITVEQSRVITKHFLRFLRRLEQHGEFGDRVAFSTVAAPTTTTPTKQQPDVPDEVLAPSADEQQKEEEEDGQVDADSLQRRKWSGGENRKEDESTVDGSTKGSIKRDDSKPNPVEEVAELAAVHAS